MSRVQYPFPASTVEQCPRNRTSWDASSNSRRCPVDVNGRSTYHCVPNQQTTALLEFCYIRQIGRYQNGTCLYLTNSGYLNQVKCTDFTNGCPQKPYLSNEIYKYQECLAINKQNHCYEAAGSCRNRTTNATTLSTPMSTTSSDYIPVLLGVMLPVILMVIFSALFMIIRHKNTSKKGDNVDLELQNLLQSNKSKDAFIKTRAYQKAREVLFEKKYVFIKGNPGDGKTTIGKHLLKELKTFHNKRVAIVMGLRELCEKREQIKNTAIFVDNLFGEYIFRKWEIEQWETTSIFLENLLSDEIDKKGNFLIVTIRNDMYSEIQSQLQFKMEFVENALVDISDSANKLTKEEMKQFYDHYVGIPFQTDELNEAFSCAPPLGFPQSCKLFGNTKTLQARGLKFFKNPSECLSQYVENMYWHLNPQFSILVYIEMKKDRVSMSSLHNVNFDTETKNKAMNVRPDKKDPPILMNFTKCIGGLLGSFLVEENGFCTFSHSSIQNVVKNALMKFDLPFVIKYCHMSLLMNLQVEGSEEKAPNLQTIDQSLFALIYERIVEILKCSRCKKLFKIISCLLFWKDKAFCTGFQNFVDKDQSVLKQLDENNLSLLVHFAGAGEQNMVKFLLTIITYNKQRYEALNQATLMNHEKIVRILLDEGVTPDAKSCFCAIQNGNKDIVMQFINADLDLFEFSESRHPFYYKRSVSILAESCLWERLELISLLLKISPGLCNVKNESGDHTIHFVAYAGATDALKALITEHKCDPYLKTDRETSILHCSCQNGKLQTAKYIISQFPDLLCAEHNRNLSALHYAAWGGNIELLKILLDKGLDISSRTNDGKTALHKCCVNGKKDMCEYLVNTYPNLIDTTDNEGHSALHVVAWGGNIDLFNLFLDKGLDINKTRNDGKTVLQLCCMNGKMNMCKFLVNTYPYLVDVINKTGGNVLHDAAWGGNINLFKFFLEKGLDINSTGYDGKTVLHKCCLNGKVDMCKYLCNTYPQLIDITDNVGENALHTAAWRGNIDLLMFLLEKGLDINRTRNDGKTVLHLCCRNGRMEMCKYLVNKYPNLLEVTNSYGHNALHDAALGGNIDLFKFLADKDFDINRTRNDGKNVLHLSCLNGKMEMCKYLVYTYPYLLEVVDSNGENALEAAVGNSNIDLLKFLLGKGLDITKTRNDGKTVLHLCCWNGKIDMCKYLVNTNPQLLEVIDSDGHNVLHDAASGGNIDVLKFLIENGLDINSTDNKGKTVLHLCCVTGKLYMCKYLVKTYPKLLNFVDNNGNTALHSAACRGDIDLIMFLLEEGLNINSIRNDGKNVLHMCCMNGMIDMCKYLVNTYPHLLVVKDKDGNNTLHATAGSGNIDLLKFLIEKGLDINSTRNDGKTVLHLCFMNSMTNMCKYLVNTYPELLDVTDNDGENVLHDAVWGGDINLFKFLLQRGLDVSSTRNDRKTVLHLCCMNGKIEMIKFLADTYPHLLCNTDNDGNSVIHAAAWSGNIELLNFLLEKGLDIISTSNDGKTVLHKCCLNGKVNMFEYLYTSYPHLIHITDNDGKNVLHDAAWGGNINMLKFLIEKGLDINSTNKNGKTVLHQCCVKGNLYTCKYLVRTYPYLLNVVDNNGNNALHSAACRGDIDLFVFLSEKGLDIDSTRNDGKNVLHICCMNGMIDMCKYLVNTYPHLLVVKDKDGHNVLHDVAWSGNIDLLKFLLDKLDINSARNDGKTVLHLSCRNNKIDMCKYLINTYPQLLDVNDKAGQTALHDAAFGGNIDLLKFLLKKGLDITRTRYDGKTVLHLCCRKGKIDMCECLVKTYSQLPYAKDNNGHSALHDAALGGNVDLIRFLLERGLDINSTRNDGKTVLHLCCMNSMTDMCKYLVKMYPLLLDVSDNDGENVLHDAAWGGDIDILKFLLRKGLDINSTRNDGKTVLHQCCLNGKIDMCKYLVDAYPNLLDITDDSGNNALHAAAWFGNIDLFNFLLEKGLDINSTRNDGKNVLQLSYINSKIEMCKYIVNKYPILVGIEDNGG